MQTSKKANGKPFYYLASLETWVHSAVHELSPKKEDKKKYIMSKENKRRKTLRFEQKKVLKKEKETKYYGEI